MSKGFDAARAGSGTKEWAEVTENCCRGCANDCRYCYAAHNAIRFGQRVRGDWSREELTKRAEITSYPARDGVVMFPSSHDITPFNLEAVTRVARLILEKGNQLLLVTKPRLECMRALLEELAPWKDQVLWRFTIGSMNSATTSYWEPGAPDPQERLCCLQVAALEGWRTSVSIEPMLAGVDSTMRVVAAVRDWVTDSIWIGKMNKARLRVDRSDPADADAVANVERLQCDEQVLRLVGMLDGDPLIRWKDSINNVIATHGGGKL